MWQPSHHFSAALTHCQHLSAYSSSSSQSTLKRLFVTSSGTLNAHFVSMVSSGNSLYVSAQFWQHLYVILLKAALTQRGISCNLDSRWMDTIVYEFWEMKLPRCVSNIFYSFEIFSKNRTAHYSVISHPFTTIQPLLWSYWHTASIVSPPTFISYLLPSQSTIRFFLLTFLTLFYPFYHFPLPPCIQNTIDTCIHRCSNIIRIFWPTLTSESQYMHCI